MKKKSYILLILIFAAFISHGQESCREQYDKIHDMEINSNPILQEKKLPLFLRIRKSKRQSRKALKLAYKTIEINDCKEYSIIVDRIIDLELKLGNASKAEEIALKRLDKLNPNWKDLNSSVNPSYLSILATISSIDASNSFYKMVRKNKGSYGVCGTTTYEEDVATLSWQVEKLYQNYGKIYCLKFLQASTIIINEDSERAKSSWDNIYDLLIQSLEIEYTYEEIKNQYESSTIQKKVLQEWEKLMWEYEFQKSVYYLEIGGVKIFFKTKECPNDQNKFKRCQPEDCNSLKIESELYKKIKQYAS
jgi:hypothetical protein